MSVVLLPDRVDVAICVLKTCPCVALPRLDGRSPMAATRLRLTRAVRHKLENQFTADDGGR